MNCWTDSSAPRRCGGPNAIASTVRRNATGTPPITGPVEVVEKRRHRLFRAGESERHHRRIERFGDVDDAGSESHGWRPTALLGGAQPDIAVRVDVRQVTGGVPAISREHLSGALRIAPVAAHHVRTAHLELGIG